MTLDKLRTESIEEEESKDELNDSGNSSETGCTSKRISRVESIENQLINSQIELEPWFFAQINSRTAAEHVIRMKGNRIGAFLVRHAKKTKFTSDAPFVLSLKFVEMPTDKQFDKRLNLQSNNSINNEQQHLKATKDILHYKIYSHSACSNCDLIMYYINPTSQFTTIRQLVSFYSENENCGLPIKLEKPCLPFDLLNCCYSSTASLSPINAAGSSRVKLNCDICNELMQSSRAKNRWSTGSVCVRTLIEFNFFFV